MAGNLRKPSHEDRLPFRRDIMKLLLSLDEVKQACVKYLEEKGFDVDIKNINVTSHIEGQYDDAREFIDGMEVTLTPGNETNNG